jgi:hypothetical protein
MKKLKDLLAAARHAQPPATTPKDRADFARTTVAAWRRAPAATPLEADWLWLRAGFCSVSAAAAVVIALAVIHPAPTRATQNPFDLVLNVADADADPLF